MYTKYGLPFLLEDKTGDVRGSEFDDLHNRMRLAVRCTLRDTTRTAYMIYDSGHFCDRVGLDFGPNNSLGAISIGSKGKHIHMNQYLAKVSPSGTSTVRRFQASDGQMYTWSWRSAADNEWTCLNSKGYHVSSYSLKPPGEPVYSKSSGSMLSIDESYPHLAVELLATLTIMRHIALYNL